jgi:hypothetical protein
MILPAEAAPLLAALRQDPPPRSRPLDPPLHRLGLGATQGWCANTVLRGALPAP